MQPRGIEFLRPIWELITHWDYLGLCDNQIMVYYTKYVNHYKQPLQPNDQSICDAVEKQLTPGKFCTYEQFSKTLFPVGTVLINENPHAMVLDTISNGEFVFKNTKSSETQFKIKVDDTDSPDEFYFLHIEPKLEDDKTTDFCTRSCAVL